MRLQARVHALDPSARARVVEVLGPGARQRSARYEVPLDVLPRLLERGQPASFWVSGEAVFTRDDLASVTHFEAVCRSIAPETEADYEANFATMDATPARDAGGFAPMRLVRGFRLSRVKVPPNAIAAIGDWTGEYVLGAAVARILRDSDATG
jgi:hypothetical protein